MFTSMVGTGDGRKGSRTIVGPMVNGAPSFGSCRPAGPRRWEPWSFTILETSGGKISAIHDVFDVANCARSGQPPHLEA